MRDVQARRGNSAAGIQLSPLFPTMHLPFGKKLHRRFTPLIFALYMSLIMALLMCSTIVALHTGFGPGYWRDVWHTYVLAMPIAFGCILLVRPVVMRLVAMTVQAHSEATPAP